MLQITISTTIFCALLLTLPTPGLCAEENKGKPETVDKYMSGVTSLTSDGDNGEAYFSNDGKKLIFQSNRGGFECDKIWTMNIDGSEKQRVSPDHGAHTCSFYYPDNKTIVFASTSHLKGACPPKAKFPAGVRYAWPLYPYNIFSAKKDGS